MSTTNANRRGRRQLKTIIIKVLRGLWRMELTTSETGSPMISRLTESTFALQIVLGYPLERAPLVLSSSAPRFEGRLVRLARASRIAER
jgi:hypothetical protein